MIKKLLFLFAIVLLSSCSDNGVSNKNPYIPNYSFTVDINTSLPAYSNLKFPSNAVFYAGAGARGLIVFNTGSGYNAFDAACNPNHQRHQRHLSLRQQRIQLIFWLKRPSISPKTIPYRSYRKRD